MKTKYEVHKSGFYDDDEGFVDGELIDDFQTEGEAFELLKTLDEDWHFIQRKEYIHIAEGIYDWETDESYGVNGHKWMHDFKKEPITKH